MSHAPIPVMFLNGVFYPLDAYRNLAASEYGDGELVTLAPIEDRSPQSHRFYFAVINKAHANLPEGLAERFPTPDALRYYALIRAGYRREHTKVFSSPADATMAAALIKPNNYDTIVNVAGAVVTIWSAESQSPREMPKERFEASKTAVFDVLASMIGTDPVSLLENAETTT